MRKWRDEEILRELFSWNWRDKRNFREKGAQFRWNSRIACFNKFAWSQRKFYIILWKWRDLRRLATRYIVRSRHSVRPVRESSCDIACLYVTFAWSLWDKFAWEAFMELARNLRDIFAWRLRDLFAWKVFVDLCGTCVTKDLRGTCARIYVNFARGPHW